MHLFAGSIAGTVAGKYFLSTVQRGCEASPFARKSHHFDYLLIINVLRQTIFQFSVSGNLVSSERQIVMDKTTAHGFDSGQSL